MALHAHGTPRERLTLAAAKIRCGEAAGIVAAGAHQIHGAIGFTMEYDLQLFTRRAKAYELTGGGVAGHLEQVARCLGLEP